MPTAGSLVTLSSTAWGRDDSLDLGGQVQEMREEMESMADGPVLPFARDWGGSYFCYDLSKATVEKDYPVLFWNHEYSEEPDDRDLVWSPFAKNFVAFIRAVVAK